MELLWSNPVMVASLIEPAILPLAAAIRFAKRWQPFDPLLDIKLLHAAFPSEDGGVHDVDIERARRALALVTELPVDRHILVPLVRLLCSPDSQVRSKAAAIYGRTSKNPEWVRKKLAETDARVRANAVESLWGADSEPARAVLKEASRDRNHRVAANALIGLHRSGADVTVSLQQMASGADPLMRAASAYAMGQVLKSDFKPLLEQMLRDSDPRVRGRALQSLIRLRRQQKQMVAAVSTPPPDGEEPAVSPDRGEG
jgi:HEAT repeat protein